jgi:hypothetical protein
MDNQQLQIMSEPSTTLQVVRFSTATTQSEAAPQKLPGCSSHWYRIGIIGSKSTGKTCLLAALGMARNPNASGCTASKLPVGDVTDTAMSSGDEWINHAIKALEDGKWPEPNPNIDRHLSVRFRFTDGQTREKMVELFDYSGELLNPKEAHADLAKRLRMLLQKMDGLIVLAEHPLSGRDSSEVEKALNGLLQVFGLLVEDRRKNPDSAERQIPIAMIVNKWDRSPHFDANSDGKTQSRVMSEAFLASLPPPFHASVEMALRPAAPPDCFKTFAVSAVGAVRCEDFGGEMREMPPAKGRLSSLGVEDPFLWVIQKRDEIDIAEQEQSIKRGSNWLLPPYPAWLRHRGFRELRARYSSSTPEGERMTSIARRSVFLAVRQMFVYLGVILAAEGVHDGWRHAWAEVSIKNSALESGWQKGTAWLRDYGISSPLRHTLYSRTVLTKLAARERVIQVCEEKDKEAWNSIPKLSSSGVPLEEGRLADSEKMAIEQMDQFPNSPFNDARKAVIAKVKHLREDLAFEKRLGGWEQQLESLSPKQGESNPEIIQIHLKDLATLATNVRETTDVPLDGLLRERWKKLVTEMGIVRKTLAEKGSALDLAAKIRQSMDADDYLQVADLLTSEEFRKNPDSNLLNKFQLSLCKHVQEKANTLSKQGENWDDAVQYAEKFLEPARRDVVTPALLPSIKNTVNNARSQGDRYLYDLAQKNKNNDTLDHYLQNAPLQSMAAEVANYRKWLDDREALRNLTFRVVKIVWDGNHKKGWGGYTALKFYVNGSGDSRNNDKTDCSRADITSDGNGMRAVSVNNLAQRDNVEIVFQAWHVEWHVIGGEQWEKLGSVTQNLSPEDLVKQPVIFDSAGDRIELLVEGVKGEPELHSWHSAQ